MKCIDIYWCDVNCGNSTEEFDKNEFGDTDEDDDHCSDEDLSEWENEQDNNDWQRIYYKKEFSN